MAGFRVVWANEFVPAAQDSYRANMSRGCILDTRDIKTVTAGEIFAATGLKPGELDLFDGSPPCQAFSTAGKREKGWGKKKTYEHGAQQCNETLFGEYVRLLRGLQPKTFVAENVSGLVRGTAKGWFLDVLKSLKDSGYRVQARLLDAQWLGVPQMRQRIIFVGVREDLGREPVHPEPFRYRYSVRDALPHLTACRTSAHGFRPTRVRRCSASMWFIRRASPTVLSSSAHTVGTLMAVTGDREGIQELRRTLLATPELNNWLSEQSRDMLQTRRCIATSSPTRASTFFARIGLRHWWTCSIKAGLSSVIMALAYYKRSSFSGSLLWANSSERCGRATRFEGYIPARKGWYLKHECVEVSSAGLLGGGPCS